MLMLFFFLFFKQKTAYEMRISDWSSDVCSSDLVADAPELLELAPDNLAKLRQLTDQALYLFGRPAFEHYDFLVALSSRIGGIGQIGRASCRERVCQYV